MQDRSDPSGRWADLGLRAVSALVLAPIAIAGVWLGGIAFAAIVTVTTIGLGVEWLSLLRAGRRRTGFRATWMTVGLGYVLLAAAALVWLRSDPMAGRADVLFLLCVVWSNDVGAYLLGRLIGGPRLAPRTSPGKTWSGAAGGLLVAIAAGLIAAHVLSGVPPLRAMPAAALLGVVAQGGDLLESFVKRRLEVKDSGHLIPGHGGLFDRLDALLAAAPVAALLALIHGRGVVLWQ
ncbi:MAG TPA: phosphatidate cytidylyltransferase [Acetobacteraceae bacterium]|nr:phosphatidate cytidylyltransferase [Acetobacteraceae bacterium]